VPALYVAAFPKLNLSSLAWIAKIRKKVDPLFGIVAPHVTLFFPCTDVSSTTLKSHLSKKVIGRIRPFRLVFRSALVIPPSVPNKDSYLFLVPDEGFSEVLRLHDSIYSGVLARYHRKDIPFIPHMTVGVIRSLEEAHTFARRLNEQKFEIHTQIKTIEIKEINDDRTRTSLFILPL
jgi:2'-5' RNA ligase